MTVELEEGGLVAQGTCASQVHLAERELRQDVPERFPRVLFGHVAGEVANERIGRDLDCRPCGRGLRERAAQQILQLARILWNAQSRREVRPELGGKQWRRLHGHAS